ncbi:MAG: helix-turn-helix domain-containing protein [Candidatus Methanofastidiosia archaeon]
MMEVLVKIFKKDFWLTRLSFDMNLKYKLLFIVPSSRHSGGGHALLEFFVDKKEVDVIINYISDMKNINEINFKQTATDTYFVSVEFSSCRFCEILCDGGCFLNGCEVTESGIYMNIITGQGHSLFNLMRNLKSRGFEITILKKRSLEKNGDLTDRQKEVIEHAFGKGYFDIPRKISLKELSKEFGVSSSNLDEIIKRAERKILSRYFLR